MGVLWSYSRICDCGRRVDHVLVTVLVREARGSGAFIDFL
jgi:hypothetical protein